MEKLTIEELMREYITLQHRLDTADAIINERFTFRAQAEGKIKGLEAVEGALKSVIDTQKGRIRDLTKEIEKDKNLVSSHLRKLPDFMIVSITERDNLQVCGECPTPRDLHRHSGYYEDHPQIKKFALYAKIEFPYAAEDVLAVMRPEPLETQREGDTMPEEKTEEKTEEPTEETTEEPMIGRDFSKTTVEAGDQEPILIEIGEIDPGAGVPDKWVNHLNTYTEVMNLCYDRALSVCIIPEIAGQMALAMYNTIAGNQNASYREFLDGLQTYLTKLNEPTPPLEPLPVDPFGPPLGFQATDFRGYEKPTERTVPPGVQYDKWLIVTEYPNGDYIVSHYHEGLGGPPGSPTGKGQAIEFYRKVRAHPAVRKAYLVMNISDQVPTEDDIEKGAPIAPDAEKTEEGFTGKESDGEGT